MRNFIKTLALVFLFAFAHVLFGTMAQAQTDRATLEGAVTDSTGGTISGANVKIVEVATGISQERKANSSGYYRFPGLAVGEYTVAVSNPSFKSKVLDHVILLVGETQHLTSPWTLAQLRTRSKSLQIQVLSNAALPLHQLLSPPSKSLIFR